MIASLNLLKFVSCSAILVCSETGIIGYWALRLVKLWCRSGRTDARAYIGDLGNSMLTSGGRWQGTKWLKTIMTRQNRMPSDWYACPLRLVLLSKQIDRAPYFAPSFLRIRRSSMKQSPEVVQRTQPIMMITFMSIGAGSSPACACNFS
jgi:hypothetical protein